MKDIVECPCEYFTATILEWKKLLKPDKYKEIIVESFSFLVKAKRVIIYGYVIMDNHIHIIWQATGESSSKKLRLSFMRYSAHQIKFDLQIHHPRVLENFYVGSSDREYQFWERNPLSVELYTDTVFFQKLEYIHWNPVKAGFCELPEEYEYSSAQFYIHGKPDRDWITNYRDHAGCWS